MAAGALSDQFVAGTPSQPCVLDNCPSPTACIKKGIVLDVATTEAKEGVMRFSVSSMTVKPGEMCVMVVLLFRQVHLTCWQSLLGRLGPKVGHQVFFEAKVAGTG